MTRLADIRDRSTIWDMCEGQAQHLAMAILMTAGAMALMAPSHSLLLGLSAPGWAGLSIALALMHQALVALVFRLQLHRNLLNRMLGARDLAVWTMVFMPFLGTRPLGVILTGWADTQTIGLPRTLEWALGGALVLLALWTLHSVITHFTIRRAVGGDHFRDEIAALPLVREGMFQYSRNAMYGMVFQGLWGIALLFDSWNALVLALFQHGYIWVHMYCTESPDMGWIYGNR